MTSVFVVISSIFLSLYVCGHMLSYDLCLFVIPSEESACAEISSDCVVDLYMLNQICLTVPGNKVS